MDSRINTIYPKSGKTFETLLKLQLFYNLFYCIIQVDLVPGYYVIFAILGCFVFFKMLCNVRLDGGAFSHSFWTCFILYVLYSLFIVTNFNGDYSINTILRYTYIPSGIIFYLAPLVMLRYANIRYLPILNNFVYKQTVLYIILLILFMSYGVFTGLNIDKKLDCFECLQLYIGGGLVYLLMFQDAFNKRQKRIIWIGILLTMFFAAYMARRTVLATYVIGVFFYMMAKTLGASNVSNKIFKIVCYSIIIILVVYFIFQYGQSLFPILAGRLQDDTRSAVELEVSYLLEHSGKYWTGLGINSYYYSTFIDEMRDGCETGYLNMMLKGGIIYLVLFYVMCIPVMIKLFFKKRKNVQSWNYLLYLFLVLIVGNAASSTFSFSIRYIIYIYIILCLYNKDNISLISK